MSQADRRFCVCANGWFSRPNVTSKFFGVPSWVGKNVNRRQGSTVVRHLFSNRDQSRERSAHCQSLSNSVGKPDP